VMLAAQGFEVPELQRYFQTVSGYGSAAPPRQVAEFRNDRRFYHLRYRYAGTLGFLERVEAHVGRQVMTDDRLDRNNPASPGTPRDEFTFNESTLDGVTLQAETGRGSQRLRYGVEFYTDAVRSSAYRETPPGSGTLTYPNGTTFFSPFPDGSQADDYGIWLLDEWHAGERLLVEGGLREDEFSGGFSLRARRCWDYAQLCAQHAERLSVRLDLREPGSLERFRGVLESHAGATPLLLEAITERAVGQLQLNGGRGVRVDAALPGLLRSLPGVRTVRLAIARPWLQ